MLWGKVKRWLEANKVQIIPMGDGTTSTSWRLEKLSGSGKKKITIESSNIGNIHNLTKQTVAEIGFTLTIDAGVMLKDDNWKETYKDQNKITPSENPEYLSEKDVKGMETISAMKTIGMRAYKFMDGEIMRKQIEFTKNVNGEQRSFTINDRKAWGSFDKAGIASALTYLGIKEGDSTNLDNMLGAYWSNGNYPTVESSPPEANRYESPEWQSDPVVEPDPNQEIV